MQETFEQNLPSLTEGTIQRDFSGNVFDAVTGEVFMNGVKLPIGVGCTSTGELWKNTIGHEIDRDEWLDGKDRERELKRQSENIADRLESQGINAYQSDNNTTMIGMCTGIIEKTLSFRNSNIIPVMQSKNVHNMLKSVKYFADKANKKHLRMFVISNGFVSLSEYREAHKAFTRQISKFAAHENIKAHGIEFAYYNIENTIHMIDGEPHLNMHSHVLYKSTKRLGGKKWRLFMDWAKTRFTKGYIRDERIRNVAECVKYVFKPSEFNQLTDIHLAELFEQTFRLKFFHPLGEIKAFRKQMKQDGLKLIKMPTGYRDTWQWHLMPKAKANAQQKKNASGSTSNIVLAITNPMPKFSNRREPCLIVRNFNGDYEALLQHRKISDLRDQAMKLWHARASMKHTTTTTVLKASSQFVDQNHSRYSNYGKSEFSDYPSPWELTENPKSTLGEGSHSLNNQLLN